MREIEAFVDPMCPWCWMTTRWIRTVQRQAGLPVTWRFLSLRLLDERAATRPPPHIAEIHGRGLEHLQLLACVRRVAGDRAVGDVLETLGAAIWQTTPGRDAERRRDQLLRPLDRRRLLTDAGLDPGLADETGGRDLAVVAHETALAVDRVGPGLGTPVITFGAGGPSFFGPVVSHVPEAPHEAVELWEALETLATHEGFAELRTGRRGQPDIPLFRALVADTAPPTVPRGVLNLTAPTVEDACAI